MIVSPVAAIRPVPWDRPDLLRRLLRTLEFAGRLVRSTPPDHGPDPAGAPDRADAPDGKPVAEAAMLLLAAARVTDSELRCATAGLAACLRPHASCGSVLAALCLDPGRARDHAIVHIILSHLGDPDPVLDKLLELSVATPCAPERLPHRELEQHWLSTLWPVGRPSLRGPIESILDRPLDVLNGTPADLYAFTHAVLYASDVGNRTVAVGRGVDDLAADADGALAVALDLDDFDLTAEILWTWPMLDLPWTPAAAFAFSVLAAVQDEHGFLPGPDFDPAVYRTLPADARDTYQWPRSYHTEFVMGFLCAAALRPERLPPAAVPADERDASIRSADRSDRWNDLTVLPVSRPGQPDPAWMDHFRRLTPDSRASLLDLPLTIALRRARDLGDLGKVQQALRIAAELDLLHRPAGRQAVGLLHRSSTAAPAARKAGQCASA